mmetsp:Transcript_13638/g.23230  ORF Transcript_13638/g.23230 Transcript_13638/m.23230 type:complete len:295 (-) Transcript_13638:425-1309(-)
MHLGKLVSVHNDSGTLLPGGVGVHAQVLYHVVELSLGVLDNVDLVGDGGSGGGLVSSDHDDLDSGGSALLDGEVHSESGGVVEGHNSDEGEVVHGVGAFDVGVLLGGLGILLVAPGLPGLHVELVTVLGVLGGVKGASGEGEHSLAEVSELGVGLVDFVSELVGELDLLAPDEDLGAAVEDALGRALHEDAEVVVHVSGEVLDLLHVPDEHVELDVRAEGDEALGVLVGLVLVHVRGEGLPRLVQVLDGLGELHQSGLGSVTLAGSPDEGELLLGDLEARLHFLHVLHGEFLTL